MFATIFRFIGEHWILSGGLVGVLALFVFAPAIAAGIARWLLGTELGRYLLAAVVVIFAATWAWEARFSAGYAAAVADQARAAESARADAAEDALKRDDASADATHDARRAADARQTEHQVRAERVREIANEPRDPVPAVCPEPDPRLVQELAEGAARVRAAEDRLRGLRPTRD